MNEKTNEGWPDPNDWVKSLKVELEKNEAAYLGHHFLMRGEIPPREVSDDAGYNDHISNARLSAGATLGTLISHLKMLPAFSDDEGLIPLRDLVAALLRLDEGVDIDFFRKRPDYPKSPANKNAHRLLVMHHAALCVEVLRWAGSDGVYKTEKAAFEFVATAFQKTGWLALEAKPLRWQRIRDWHLSCIEVDGDKRGRCFVQSKMKEFRSMDGELTVASAERFVKDVAKNRKLISVI